MNRITNGNNTTMPISAVDKAKDWQLEILMEKLRSKSAQYKSLTEISKNVRMAMLDKRYVLDSVDKSQHQKCLDTLQHSIKVTSLQSMIERLESLTRQLGLKFMVGPTGVELFISSDMFYLEIVLDLTGAVKDVKVHHESKTEQQSCAELVNCLSRGDFADFTAQLEGFTSIYQLNAEKKIKCKAFTALQSLESDLSTLAQLQSFMKEPFNLLYKSPVGVLEKRRGGHPMKLTYFLSPYDLLNVEKCDIDPITVDAIISKNLGYSVTVCMEGSATHKLQTTTLITVNRNINGKSTPSFCPLSNQNSAAIPACFVLKLNKPMPMCTALVRQIQQATELDTIDQSLTHPLLNLIVHHESDGKMESGNSKGLFVTLPDQTHCYFLTENKNMDGVLVSSIPFTHPTQVSKILVILRQQALFNTIIASCVRPNSRQDYENMTMFEISALSWTHISLSLEHPMEECMATAEIDLSDISNLICRIRSPGTPPPANSPDPTSEMSTKILNRCFSIPVTMRSVIKLWEKQAARRNHYNGHENFSLPLGSGDPGGHKGAPGNNLTEFGGLDKIKQEPPGGNGTNHQNQMFLSETMMAAGGGTFHQNFQQQHQHHQSEGMLTNLELTNILSGAISTTIIPSDSGGKSLKRQHKRKSGDDLWKNVGKQRLKDDSDILLETSSSDSTSRSTPISQDNEIATPNSALGFQSDLELSSLDPAELLCGDKTEFGSSLDELGDVEEMLAGPSTLSRRKSSHNDQKSPPTNILLELGDKNLVPPSVSITPIAATTSSSMMGFNQGVVGGGNAEKRPGIEIIPLATSAASVLPSSITITPITNASKSSIGGGDDKNRGEKKSSKRSSSSSDDKSRLEKKRKRKRDESPMGPPEKVPPKQDPLTKPVTVSIKPAESPPLPALTSTSGNGGNSGQSTPTSPGLMRKFNASPTQNRNMSSSSMASSGKLSPNLMKPTLKTGASSSASTHHSPKHSPAHVPSSPKHSIVGISSPKSHGTSPKHPSTSGSGKPSMSTLKSAANSPSSKSGGGGSGSDGGGGKSKSTSSSKDSSREKEKKMLFAVGSGGAGSTTSKSNKSGGGGSTSSVKMKPLELNAEILAGIQDGLPSPSSSDLSKCNPNQVRNRKGSLSAIVDKLKSAQHCDGVTDLSSKSSGPSSTNKERQSGSSGGQITSVGSKTPSENVKIGGTSGAKLTSVGSSSTSGGNSNSGSETKNSEYMVKPSSDGMKITINKTRTKDKSSSGTSGTNLAKSSGGTGSPKTHTGLKPGVNSGPASKKPSSSSQHLQQKLGISGSGTSASGLTNSNYVKSNKLPSASSSSSSANLKLGGQSGGTKVKLTGSPKTGSGATDLTRKDRPKLNKSNSEKSIFSSKEGRKGSPTQSNRDDASSGGSTENSLFKLGYPSPLMMEGLMKQLDKNFQIPKLSARAAANNNNNNNSGSNTSSDDKKKLSATTASSTTTTSLSSSTSNSDNLTTISASTTTTATTTGTNNNNNNINNVNNMLTKTELPLPKYPLAVPGSKMFEMGGAATTVTAAPVVTQSDAPIKVRNNVTSPLAALSSSNLPKLLKESEDSVDGQLKDLVVIPVTTSTLQGKDDLNFKMTFAKPAAVVSTPPLTVTPLPMPVTSSSVSSASNEPLSLTKSIDLTSKFVTPALPKDDLKKEVIKNLSPTTTITPTGGGSSGASNLLNKNDGSEGLLDFSSTSTSSAPNKLLMDNKQSAVPMVTFPQSPSVSISIVKSPAPSPLITQSPHSASPCITDDELMDEALIGIGK